jgi:TonB family protein
VSVQIAIDLGTDAPSAEAADAATSKIFLDAQDSLTDLVPNYWKSCIRSALINGAQNCQFSPEIVAIPGVISSEGVQSGLLPLNPSLDIPKSFRVGNGVSPPRQIDAPEPEFSDAARGVKFQGTVVLWVIVNNEGVPTGIRILSPVGAGLDAKAVQAVKGWKFKPAEKDGQPVSVAIAVQVDFHLY